MTTGLCNRFLVLAGCKHRGYCRSERRVDGKTILVTGANTGIGYTAAEFLWRRGGDVVLLCRDRSRAEAAIDQMKRELEPGMTPGKLKLFLVDLSSFASVRKCADKLNRSLDRIDILINNAGVCTPPFTLTEDGFELTFAVNHLGHFLLTLLLLPKIMESAPARIVNVSSEGHLFCLAMDELNDPKKYYGVYAYCRSKMANVIFTRELSKRLRGTGVNVYSVNPGYVQTELYRTFDNFVPGFKFIMMNLMTCYVKDWWEGAQTIIHCSICESTDQETGLYYEECQVSPINPVCKDDELCRWLWDKSLEWTGLDPALDPTNPPTRRTPSGHEDITAVDS